MKFIILILTLLLFSCKFGTTRDNASLYKDPQNSTTVDRNITVQLASEDGYIENNDQNAPKMPEIKIVFSKNIDLSDLKSTIYLVSKDNPVQHIELIFKNNGANIVFLSLKLPLANNTDYIIHISPQLKTLEGKYIPEKSFNFRTSDDNNLVARMSIETTRPYQINLNFTSSIIGYDVADAIKIINISGDRNPVPLLVLGDPLNHRQIKILTPFLTNSTQYTLFISNAIKDEITHNNVFNSRSDFTIPALAEISAKGDSTCAIYNNNTYCWGDNDSGQLGNGNKQKKNSPTIISPPEDGSIKKFAEVYLANHHACGVSYTSYNISCWGNNSYGQLGTGNYIEYRIQQPINMKPSMYFYKVIAGGDTTCAIGADHRAYCWGRGTEGELGNLQNNDSYNPTPITMPENVNHFTAISVGDRHVCAIGDNRLYCWGDNTYGQLGISSKNSTNVPTQVVIPDEIKNVSAVSAGDRHTCVIADNKVYCWGANANGQIGNGDHVTQSTPVLVKMPDNLNSISAISTGSRHTCTIADNKVYCWGANSNGQLGDTTNIDSSTPILVNMPSNIKILSSISLGTNHTCITSSSNNTAYCWGANANGQLGTGTNDSSNFPVKVIFPIDPHSISR